MENEYVSTENTKLSKPLTKLEIFKNSYLKSLQTFLIDEKFKEKSESLPKLKSTIINKYEKIFAQNKKNKKNEKIFFNIKNKSNLKMLNIQNKNYKSINTRYIILDNQLINIDLKSIEDDIEMNRKLLDPFSSYFKEDNDKLRKNAKEQILNNIFNDKNDYDETFTESNTNRTKTETLPDIQNNTRNKIFDFNSTRKSQDDDVFYKDLEYFDEKYQINNDQYLSNVQRHKNEMEKFREKCRNYNIISLGQKIDFFTYLFNNGFSTKSKSIEIKKTKSNNNTTFSMSKKFMSRLSLKSMSKRLSIRERKDSIMSHSRQRYYQAIKSEFKIGDDIIKNNLQNLEKFEKDLKKLLSNYSLILKSFEQSQKYVDKLRISLTNKEISSDKIIIREFNITSDKLLYLLYKNYFEFTSLKVLNLSKNNLCDTGCSYLLYLISFFGTNLEQLNISYTLFGKNSIKILSEILSDNIIKIKNLSISGNKIGEILFKDIFLGISKNIHLNKLYIADNNLGKISSFIIGTILKYDKKLKLLDVSKNNFGDEFIGNLMKGIIVNSNLEILFLNDLNLTNKSFRNIATTLSKNVTLKQLFLERNYFNDKIDKILSEFLNSNKSIEFISFVGNNLENEQVSYIIEQQRLIKLKVISKSEFLIQTNSSNYDDYLW